MRTVQELKDIVRAWQGKRIGVIGDVMLDHYIEGEVTRISPEAPVPVVKVTREWYAPGGAANVAANVAALGSVVNLCGVVGHWNDTTSRLLNALMERGVDRRFLQTSVRQTTEKIRIVVQGQQIVRMDRETTEPITDYLLGPLMKNVRDMMGTWDAVILSDYAKGTLTSAVIEGTLECARRCGKPVVGDPKPQNIRLFCGATVLTPNMSEAADILRMLQAADCRAAASILQTTLLVTAGGGGMTVYSPKEVEWISTVPRDVYDVVGAGDTVVAAVALSLASGVSLSVAARIANAAAGVVVGKRGTATCSTEELLAALDEVDEMK